MLKIVFTGSVHKYVIFVMHVYLLNYQKYLYVEAEKITSWSAERYEVYCCLTRYTLSYGCYKLFPREMFQMVIHWQFSL